MFLIKPKTPIAGQSIQQVQDCPEFTEGQFLFFANQAFFGRMKKVIKMQLLEILFYILMAFAGFAVGRISHIYGGHINVPHHWIYGLILIIPASIFSENLLWLLAFSFGTGLFLGDLKDFLHLKFFGADEPGKKKFWGID